MNKIENLEINLARTFHDSRVVVDTIFWIAVKAHWIYETTQREKHYAWVEKQWS